MLHWASALVSLPPRTQKVDRIGIKRSISLEPFTGQLQQLASRYTLSRSITLYNAAPSGDTTVTLDLAYVAGLIALSSG
jgi:hypothetical protein